MGKGGDLIIMDEAAEITREAYAKITRMLGDDPENSCFVEIYNPWNRDTKAFDHSVDPTYIHIAIDWRVGVQEGRTTEDFIEEQKREITPLEFTVLYESKFPDQTEDSLHYLEHISEAENINYRLLETFEDLKRKLEDLEGDKLRMSESKYRTETGSIREELARYVKVVACDPADKGLDYSVILWGVMKDKQVYEVCGMYSEAQSEQMELVGRVMRIAQDFIGGDRGEVRWDNVGIGIGALSRCREIKNEKGLSNVRVIGCGYGEKAVKDLEFMNKKAENNFRLKHLFSDRQVSLHKVVSLKDYRRLKNELMNMRWDITSGGKKRVIDPKDKSPDFNDALVYFVWDDRKELAFAFL